MIAIDPVWYYIVVLIIAISILTFLLISNKFMGGTFDNNDLFFITIFGTIFISFITIVSMMILFHHPPSAEDVRKAIINEAHECGVLSVKQIANKIEWLKNCVD